MRRAMRTWTTIAATLTLASAGVWAAVMPDQQGTAESGTQKRIEKRVVVTGDDEAPMLKSLTWASRDVEIGVSIRDQDASATGAGAVVDEVRQDSPAGKAGVKAGDVVVEFDGEHVRSARHLSRLVEETASGHTVKIAVMRDGKRMELSVTPEEGRAAWFGADTPMVFEGSARMKPGEPPFKLDAPQHDFDLKGGDTFFYKRAPGEGFDVLMPRQGRGRLGIGIQELTPQLAEYLRDQRRRARHQRRRRFAGVEGGPSGRRRHHGRERRAGFVALRADRSGTGRPKTAPASRCRIRATTRRARRPPRSTPSRRRSGRHGQRSHFGMRNAECGMRNAELNTRTGSAE